MKRIFLVFIILLMNTAGASVTLDLFVQSTEVRQGNLEKTNVVLDQAAVQQIEIQKLKGQTLSEVLYIHSVGPLVKKDGSDLYQSEMQVVFIKKPESKILTHQYENQEIKIILNDVNFISTEDAEKLIYEDFSIPHKKNIIKWVLGCLSLLLGFGIVFFVYKKQKIKKKIRLEKLAFKNRLFHAQSYEEIIAIWMDKTEILNVFPHLAQPFKKFELVLYKYQFKKMQTEAEKKIVEDSYRHFLSEVSGGFDGI